MEPSLSDATEFAIRLAWVCANNVYEGWDPKMNVRHTSMSYIAMKRIGHNMQRLKEKKKETKLWSVVNSKNDDSRGPVQHSAGSSIRSLLPTAPVISNTSCSTFLIYPNHTTHAHWLLNKMRNRHRQTDHECINTCRAAKRRTDPL